MEHIAAFMLLVGCATTGSDCREIPVPVPAYEDVGECTRDLRLQLRLNETFEGRVYGVCKEVDEAVFEQSGTLNWSIRENGMLDVRFAAEPQILASR